jgi:HPt (histidine-containing phosphotransfer) domain-containing protein
MPTPPPTSALAELAAVIGEDNVRTLVRTFLREFPTAVQNLGRGARKDRHRVAHGMKSNARLMGALELSQRMAAIELRLASPDGPDMTNSEIASIAAQYEEIAIPLRAFVGE